MSVSDKSDFRNRIAEFFGRSGPPAGRQMSPQGPRGPMKKNTINIWYIVAALAGFTLI